MGGTATERIEDVRVAWERDVEREIVARSRGARRALKDPGASEPRVQLVPAMAARVHAIATAAAERLGCPDPFVIYQTPLVDRRLSAQALLTEQPFAIRLIGPVAAHLDDAALSVLVGHELGHWLALGPRARPESILLEAWERGASFELCRLATVAAEITADRFAVVAARGDLDAAVRLEVAIQTLDSPCALGVRERDYLAELCGQIERGDASVFESSYYPTAAFRLFATWLFWRSDVHRELTGVGPGDLPLREVDARLEAICDEAALRQPASASIYADVADRPEPRTPKIVRPVRRSAAARAAEDVGVRVAASLFSALGVSRTARRARPAETESNDDVDHGRRARRDRGALSRVGRARTAPRITHLSNSGA